MVDLHPTVCNICGGKVIYIDNKEIYGKSYGSGKCYLCTSCGAHVGTHKPRPDEALGLLADERMRKGKKFCHDLFDQLWLNAPKGKKRIQARTNAYAWLAKQMDVPVEECHLGYFDLNQLRKAYVILRDEIQRRSNQTAKVV